MENGTLNKYIKVSPKVVEYSNIYYLESFSIMRDLYVNSL